MASAHTVKSSQGKKLAADRVIEILDTKLSSELDSEYGRSGSPPLTSDGIPLPDPDRYFRQSAPSPQQVKEAQEVAVHTGQRGDAQYGSYRNGGSSRQLVKVTLPWAAVVVFGRAPGPSVSDPVQSTDLHHQEVLDTRTTYYVDGIAHTLFRYGMVGTGTDPRANAISEISLTATNTAIIPVQVGQDDVDLKGIGAVEFEITQWQLLPAHAQT